MVNSEENHWFDDVDAIVSNELAFKKQLHIGKEAYGSLKAKNLLTEIWDVAGAAGTGAGIMKSALIAETFFAHSGFLSVFGLGTAITPVGWVIAGALLCGGTTYGITRFLKKAEDEKCIVIPNFINSPIDVLGLSLFDLMAPLAIKVASSDDEISKQENERINQFFIKEWGYDKYFVSKGIGYYSSIDLSESTIEEIAADLAAFKKANKDCKYEPMSEFILEFLQELIESDGRIDERENAAIEKAREVFTRVGNSSSSLSRFIEKVVPKKNGHHPATS